MIVSSLSDDVQSVERGETDENSLNDLVKNVLPIVLKDEIEVCISLRRFHKSTLCCSSVARGAESSAGASSPNIENEAVTILER